MSGNSVSQTINAKAAEVSSNVRSAGYAARRMSDHLDRGDFEQAAFEAREFARQFEHIADELGVLMRNLTKRLDGPIQLIEDLSKLDELEEQAS